MEDMAISTGTGRTYRYFKGPKPLFEFAFGLSFVNFSLKCTTANDEQTVAMTTEWLGCEPTTTYSCSVTNTGKVSDLHYFALFMHSAFITMTESSTRSLPNTLLMMLSCLRCVAQMDGDEVVFLFHKPAASLAATTAFERNSGSWALPIKQLLEWQRVFVPAGKTVHVPLTLTTRMLKLRSGPVAVPTLHEGEHALEISRGHGAVISATVVVHHEAATCANGAEDNV